MIHGHLYFEMPGFKRDRNHYCYVPISTMPLTADQADRGEGCIDTEIPVRLVIRIKRVTPGDLTQQCPRCASFDVWQESLRDWCEVNVSGIVFHKAAQFG